MFPHLKVAYTVVLVSLLNDNNTNNNKSTFLQGSTLWDSYSTQFQHWYDINVQNKVKGIYAQSDLCIKVKKNPRWANLDNAQLHLEHKIFQLNHFCFDVINVLCVPPCASKRILKLTTPFSRGQRRKNEEGELMISIYLYIIRSAFRKDYYIVADSLTFSHGVQHKNALM